MRVCELVLAPAIGGAETLASNLADALRIRGHEVDLIALDPPAAHVPASGAKAFDVAARSRWAAGEKLGRLRAAQLLFRCDYDVIHAHTYLPNLYARAAARLSRRPTPVVVTLHSGSDDFAPRMARLLESSLLPRTAGVVAVSRRLADEYKTYFPSASSRVVHVPNGVRKLPFRASGVTRPAVFAVVGRLAPIKDVATAIRGFGRFAEQVDDPDLTLRIIGPPSDVSYADELAAVASEVGHARIIFEGPLADPFDSRIDVLIQASRYESGPISLMEAAAHSIPIVCADVRYGGTADLQEVCMRFAFRQPDALADGLRAVYHDWPAAVGRAQTAWRLVPDLAAAIMAYESILSDAVHSIGRARATTPHGLPIGPTKADA